MTKPSESPRRSSILVVEDEALIALEIQERLTHSGFDVVDAVDSGERAIRASQELRPDLILMDIRLKGEMSGVEAAGRIRQLLDIPIVYLTAHADAATLERAKQTEPFGYVLKPFQERDLIVAIEMAIHRHHLEQRLKESQQKYAATLSSIGDGVCATDSEGRITYLNPVAEALTGWKLADAEGMAVERVFSVIQERSRSVIENPAVRALREGIVVKLTEPVILVSRNNELIPIDDSSAPLKTDRGNVIGAVVAFRDIRDRRLAEDALHRAEEQLHQALKMEAIGRLAGGVAHDFNNLLTAINGYCDLLLQNGTLDRTATDRVQQIRKAGEQAASLTGQLLAFGRKQMLRMKRLDLNTHVVAMKNLFHRLIGEDVILINKLSPGLRAVTADPSRLEQVIMNLAVNARDAMPTGGQLTIETANVDFDDAAVITRPEIKPGRYVMLSVSDTGCGFDETVKERLFEPFFTTKELGKGTGLGLATVYGIVKQFQGFIYVYSEQGKGTTFKIYLPATADAKDISPSGEVLIQSALPDRGTETILLVEDEEAVRTMFLSFLKELGYTVLPASNGEQAVQVGEQFGGQIDLVVTDVVMPKMGGPQLAERLALSRPGVPVLYLSGYSDEAVFRNGPLEKTVLFLQKPFALSELAAKIRQTLDVARRG